MAGLIDILFPAIAANKRKQEEHELNIELAKSKKKVLDAELEMGERKLRAMMVMDALINRKGDETFDVPSAPVASPVRPEEFEGGGPAPMPEDPGVGAVTMGGVPKPPGLSELARAMIGIDPKAATDLFEKEATIGQKNRELDLRAEAQRNIPSLIQQMLGQAGGGGGGVGMRGLPGAGVPAPASMPTLSAGGPTAPAESTMGAVAGPTGPPGPAMTMKPTFNIDKDGNVSFSATGERTQYQIQSRDVPIPGGRIQKEETVFDPVRGTVVERRPLGVPTSPEFMQKAEALAEGLGIERTSPLFGRAVSQIIAAQALPPEAQAEMLAALQRVAGGAGARRPAAAAPESPGGPATAVPGVPSTGGGLSLGGALDAAGARRVRQAGREQAASSRARVVTEREESPLQGTDRTRYNALVSAERQADEIKKLYRPEFVGKGFTAYRDRFKKEFETQAGAASKEKYVPGAIAGAMRSFMGTPAPGEVAFRRGVSDISDTILRARSGAQINEEEFQRMKGMLFSLLDEPATFLAALERFRAEVGRMIDDTLKTGSTSASDLLKQRQGRDVPQAPAPGAMFDWDPTQGRLVPRKP